MITNSKNKQMKPAGTKEIGEDMEGKFFFPAQDDTPAMTIEADTLTEAQAKYNALKKR